MAELVVLSADELIALDIEGRGKARRTARETPTTIRVLRAFLDRGGPVPVDEIVAGLTQARAQAVREALAKLDDDDLVRIRDGHVDVAYPFSASPTAFLVQFEDGRKRYVCCAIDALGTPPMVGERIEIRSRCHHCGVALAFPVTPEGPGPEAAGVMLWVGKRTEERCKVADSL